MAFLLVDLRRFELPTPTMRMWCAPNCATSPFCYLSIIVPDKKDVKLFDNSELSIINP